MATFPITQSMKAVLKVRQSQYPVSLHHWSPHTPLWLNPSLHQFYIFPDPNTWASKGIKYLNQICADGTLQTFKNNIKCCSTNKISNKTSSLVRTYQDGSQTRNWKWRCDVGMYAPPKVFRAHKRPQGYASLLWLDCLIQQLSPSYCDLTILRPYSDGQTRTQPAFLYGRLHGNSPPLHFHPTVIQSELPDGWGKDPPSVRF